MSTTSRSVWELQTILKGLGAPIEVDKTYGPVTERTWSLLSSRLNLDPLIEQASPQVARVDERTYLKLLNEYILRGSPKPKGANDFERLNNAIVLLGRVLPSNPQAKQLTLDWDRIAGDPTWRSLVGALPPVWAASLTSYWGRYFDVWNSLTTEEKLKLVHPAAIEPGGVLSANAWRDLWEPALDEAMARGRTLIEATGKQLAASAAKETRQQTYDWVWSLSGLVLGAAGVWLLLRNKQRRT